MTWAPARRASWTANTPTPPAAPPMSTTSPARAPITLIAASAVRPQVTRVLAVTSSMPSGVCRSGSAPGRATA